MPVNQEPQGQIGAVMQAHYGDAGQAAWNAAHPSSAQARAALGKYKDRHEGRAHDKVWRSFAMKVGALQHCLCSAFCTVCLGYASMPSSSPHSSVC